MVFSRVAVAVRKMLKPGWGQPRPIKVAARLIRANWKWVTGAAWTADDANNFSTGEPNGDSEGLAINRYGTFTFNDEGGHVGGYIVEIAGTSSSRWWFHFDVARRRAWFNRHDPPEVAELSLTQLKSAQSRAGIPALPFLLTKARQKSKSGQTANPAKLAKMIPLARLNDPWNEVAAHPFKARVHWGQLRRRIRVRG